MTLARSPFKAAIFLTLLSILGVHALAQGGAVPGTAPKPAAAAPTDNTTTTTPATGDSKLLPWKFLAKPMGALDSSTWSPFLKSFDCDDAPKCPMPDDKKLNELFGVTIGKLPKSQSGYVVVHVVQYPNSARGGSSAPNPPSKTIVDHWYLYRSLKSHYGDPKWTYEKFSGQRIYGASSVYFLFLHVNARVITLSNATKQVECMIQLAKGGPTDKCSDDKRNQSIKADLDAAGVTNALKQLPDNFSDDRVNDAIASNDLKTPSGDVQFCEATSGDQFDWSTQSGISSTYKRIRYEAAVVKRTPANIENLKLILGLLFGKANAEQTCLKLAADDVLWGAGRIDNIILPSDISFAGYLVKNDEDVDKPVQEADRSSLQVGTTGSYNDEQLYWWDASIGIPVHKIKDLQYSDSDNTVTAAQVDKQSAYAMFNLMLHPVDLSSPGANVWPRILVGFPLASSPWDKLFAGGAIGLPWKPFRNFQFFAGATFMRAATPATLSAGQTANNAQLQNDLRIKMTPKLTVGINVPVKSVIDKLKK